MTSRSSWFPSSILQDFERMRQEMDSLFNSSARQAIRQSQRTFPPISMCETGEDVRVYAFAPGVDPKKCDVSIQGSNLMMSFERIENFDPVSGRTEARFDKAICHRNERAAGEYTRVVSLPENVDSNQIHASYDDGILSVFVGKKPEMQSKKIEIKAK